MDWSQAHAGKGEAPHITNTFFSFNFIYMYCVKKVSVGVASTLIPWVTVFPWLVPRLLDLTVRQLSP